MKGLSSSPALFESKRCHVTIAMDRSKWEKTLTCFQASARGYLVRDEVRRTREDFEDIVREIDGSLTHVEWKETVIAIPHFTDNVDSFNRKFVNHLIGASLSLMPVLVHLQEGPFLRTRSSASKPSNASSPSSSSSSSSSAERGDPRVLQERIEAERDDCDATAAAVRQKESTELEKDGDSTTVWSSLELDMNYGDSNKAPRQSCAPEALRLHRNTLTMELVWLQQAIGSRKKYLSLKDRLSVS
ncbi:IQ domain-containing protein C isoform X1 [Anarrhichthys ocellatus]|uniref:IQ domain-containing protein C isoform X1 n=1 Tax=Anarrhichthys ocellatus TaxID=433405 RepID=UPI0012ED607A|nr:IQ domain-containing protein C isoform X1 [Anarrhichthys ocellatus]